MKNAHCRLRISCEEDPISFFRRETLDPELRDLVEVFQQDSFPGRLSGKCCSNFMSETVKANELKPYGYYVTRVSKYIVTAT